MPPDASTLSQPSALSQLAGPTLSLGSSLTSQRTPGSTVIGIMGSRSEQDALIDTFHLQPHYDTPLRQATRERLFENSTFEEDKKSGIVTITVTDRDRQTARDLAQGYVDELNTLLNKVNTSAAQREHEFLETRLKTIKAQLDESSQALSTFSSRHETLNPVSQGAALIQAQTLLQNQVGMADSELSALRASYSDGNARVRAAEARVNSLHARLAGMSRGPAQGDEEGGSGTPSLRQLPGLTVTYADLSRQIATQQAVYETLTKQMELAKVQEAKELPSAKELDSPVLAEKRSSPHRSLLAIGGLLLGLLGGCAFVAVTTLCRLANEQYGLSIYFAHLLQTERHGSA